MNIAQLYACVAVLSCVIVTSRGHGRLMEPPGRASMWRAGFSTPHNYDDNQLFCGGFSVQWNQNGGECGVCGDNWADPQPREHEAGGKYGTGTIARTYTQGQTIDVSVEITASHLGWFEFRLCPHNDPATPVTQACLDTHLLITTAGATRVSGIDAPRFYNYAVRLPDDVTCSQCVLQWKYNTGNSWGTDPVTGESGLGFGPQEQFYGCADVKIMPADDVTGNPASTSAEATSSTTSTTTSTTTVPPSATDSSTTSTTQQASTSATTDDPTSTTTSDDGTSTECRSAGAYEGLAGMDYWCVTNCAAGYCPGSHCTCEESDTVAFGGDTPACVSAGLFTGYPGMDLWCDVNCATGYCPESHCACADDEEDEEDGEEVIICQSAGAYEGVAGMDAWCQTHCALGDCPTTHCSCSSLTLRRKRELSENAFRNFITKSPSHQSSAKLFSPTYKLGG